MHIPDITTFSVKSEQFATPVFFDSTHRYHAYHPAEEDASHWAFDLQDQCIPEPKWTTQADGVSYSLDTGWADLVRSDVLEARLVVHGIWDCGHFPPNMIIPNSFDLLSILYSEYDSLELPIRIIHLYRDMFLDLCGFIIWWSLAFEEGSYLGVSEKGRCVVVFPLKDAEHMNIEKWIHLDYLSSSVFMHHHDRNIPVETELSMKRDRFNGWRPKAGNPILFQFNKSLSLPGLATSLLNVKEELTSVTIWCYKLCNYLDGSILPSRVEKILHDSESYSKVMSWGAAKEYYAPSCAPCIPLTKILGEDLGLMDGPLFSHNRGYPFEVPILGPMASSSLLLSDISEPFHSLGLWSDMKEADVPSLPALAHARSPSCTVAPSNLHICKTPTKQVFCGSVQEIWNLENKPMIRVIDKR
ncbi:hypothetical protein F5146DRAFT_1004020 [Armillaria mellea]|nr:hypothetical protein F5146DRAFT_1004020 [Armillaria mellea]